MSRAVVSLAAILVLGLCLGGLALTQVAQAQTVSSYPTVLGAVSGAATCATPGSTTNVTATVVDIAGDPVEGAKVAFRIVSQPGNNATWINGMLETTAASDANGVATALLACGSEPGNIIVETLSGEMMSQVTVVVSETCVLGVVQAPTEPEQPPAEAEGLPATGSSPADGPLGLPTWQIAVLAIGVAALASGFVIIVRRSGRA